MDSQYSARAIVPNLTLRVRVAPCQITVSTYPLARAIEPCAVAQLRLSRFTRDILSLPRLDVFAVAMGARAVQDWHAEFSGVNTWVQFVTGLQHFRLASPTANSLAALCRRTMGSDVGSDVGLDAAFMGLLECPHCHAKLLVAFAKTASSPEIAQLTLQERAGLELVGQ
ncbi:hypothetical protein GGF31_008428 [Allomyces arbusculus]|nr:hypothetical protein GGF31_008428 [Allomyces arbusculus]